MRSEQQNQPTEARAEGTYAEDSAFTASTSRASPSLPSPERIAEVLW